ncbi:MAG: PEP-CTERM sorting domain-containing protein [Acidobacteria bacterium]|nr:PEP-CTERM sorting domain-containing protein [Acidobacteriota bacterium]
MRLISLLVLSMSSLFAVPYTVSSSGIFNGATPTTFFTAPNQTWSFSFLIDSNPVPVASFPTYANLPISSFVYRLNGNLVASSPSFASFETLNLVPGGFPGGFTVGAVQLLTGQQLFSGTTASPTILPGVYNFTNSNIGLNPIIGGQVTISAAVPEPASVGLSLLGLVGLGLLRRRTRK